MMTNQMLNRVCCLTIVSVTLCASLDHRLSAQPPRESKEPAKPATDQSAAENPQIAPPAAPKVGLAINEPAAYAGYTLLAPMNAQKVFLVDLEGRVVRTWDFQCNAALSAYLLDNGNVLRAGALPGGEQKIGGPGAGGRVQELSWDGETVWDFRLSNEKQLPHHDITRLPDGNVLMIVWDKKSKAEAIAAGKKTDSAGESLLADSIIEVKPTGKTTGEIVWQWNVWDHLIQDVDKNLPNYGRVTAHPELVDLNFGDKAFGQMMARKDDADKLRSIGYVGGPAPAPGGAGPGRGPMDGDWTHFNSVAYNADLDQIAVSVHAFSEVWIIDHGTTTAEAASHKGGKRGHGGDLLYRWGNPRAYRSGSNVDQRLFSQHNAQWISKGLPGAGNLLVFNNGNRRPDGEYSSVDEIVLPVNPDGTYERKPGLPFGPEKATWSYAAPNKSEFYSMLISGAQRLPNGSTLICSGLSGTVFEIDAEQKPVWKYVNPVKGSGFPGGMPGPFGPPAPGTILPSFLQDVLRLDAEQKQKIEQAQTETLAKINEFLSDEQKKSLREPTGFGFGQLPRAGELISSAQREKLRLTDEQNQKLDTIQAKTDQLLADVLNDGQKQQLEQMRNFGRGGPGGFGGPPGGLAAGRGPIGPPAAGTILAPFVQDALRLSAEQKEKVEAAQKKNTAELDVLFSDEQKQALREPTGFGFGQFPRPGELFSSAQREKLKFSEEQKQTVDDLQKKSDQLLALLLNDDQKKQLDQMQNAGRGGPGGFGPPGGFPGGPRGGPRGGPGGGFPGGGFPGGPFAGGPGGPGGPFGAGNPLFRAYRYGVEHPAFSGRQLAAGKLLVDLEAEQTRNQRPPGAPVQNAQPQPPAAEKPD
jgi:hypothetical protein